MWMVVTVSEKDWTCRDVERLIGDLDRDGFEVDKVKTNSNPVSGEKRLIIDLANQKDK